jgi:hypothetical protein
MEKNKMIDFFINVSGLALAIFTASVVYDWWRKRSL